MILNILGHVRDINTPNPNGGTWGDVIKKQLNESAKQGVPIMQVIKGWQMYYKE